MAYSVRVERIGPAGTPRGAAALYEADREIEAVTIATYEVDAHRSGPQRLATAFDAAGAPVLAYAGRAEPPGDAVGRRRWPRTSGGTGRSPTATPS